MALKNNLNQIRLNAVRARMDDEDEEEKKREQESLSETPKTAVNPFDSAVSKLTDEKEQRTNPFDSAVRALLEENKRQTEEAAKTVDVSAWNSVLSDSGTKEKIKASREFAEQSLQNTPTKQKETKDALAIRNQEAKVDKLAREEEAKRKAYNDLPLIDRVMNISADEYSSDEARQKKAAEVELDRMRLTPEEFEKQHKADLGESLYQIAHAGATGVAGSFARAADVGVALVEGAKQAGRWIAGEGDEKSSVAREFTKGYQRSLVEDSLYDEVYDQYEREYQRNREIDGEVNALTKYTAQAAQSVGEQAVMLWTASLGGALWTGSKAATTVAKVSDDLMNSGKKAVRLLGRALGKFDAGALSGPASMLVTTSASSTAEAIKAMRAKNEQRISNGLEAEYSEDDIARKAALYGILNGLSETTLEYALGGVTGAAKGILPTGKVKNPILTATLSYLKGAAGEGVEEMVQTLASTGLQNLTYNAEATVNWTEVLESGIVGAISGLGMSAPSFVQNTRLGVSAMHDVSDTVKAADKADSDVAQGIVALAASSKAAAYAETAQTMRSTGSENAETLASIYDWASEQQAKIAKSLTGEETGAQIKEKAAENKNEAPSPAPTESASLISPDATQTEAQVITTDVQNKVRREAVQRENVSAENGGATVVSELTQKIKNVAPKANIQTVQKLVDAVHMVQTGTMPDKSYNEALNLLRDERVLRTVAAEVGGDFSVDTKNKTTIRASLEAVAKRYAETAEQADMDSLSEEISHAVATLPNYQSPARSASDTITTESGPLTRAEFVRNFGAELAQQGRAADDVFDNLLAAEQTPNAEVNAPIQAAEMPAMMSAAPNADVNAINRDANTFEQEANAPIQSAEQGIAVPNADVNAINREVNTFEHDANTPIQAAESIVSRETISPNATERGVHRLFSEKTPLTEIQRTSVEALDRLASAVNVDIYLYDSTETSEYGYSSGRYDVKADRVYVDINAGANYEGTILRTAGHELTHYLKRWSPEGFEDLSAFVEMTLTESGADIAALKDGKKANALKHGNELSDDVAYEEVIADACQMLLTDSDALYRLSEQNKTLFERVMDFFREFLDNLRSVYAGYKPTTEAGRIMAAQTQDVMDMLSEVYSDALIRAGKARSEAQKMISGEQSIFADAKTEQGSDLFDYRAMQADMSRYEQMLTEWGGMPEQDVSRLMAMVGHTVDVVRENAQKLDYGYDSDPNAERPFKPVKPNSDKLYKISIDFSTLCRKRIVQSIVAQNLEAALERPLSREEAIKVREALAEVQREGKQIEVACALCYVEAARLKTPAQIQKFMDNRASVLYNHFAEQDRATKDAINEAERAKKVELGYDPKAAVKGKDKNAVRDAKAAARKTYQLTDAQKAEIAYAESLPVTAFTTAKGLTELAENHHDIYKAYADAVRAASHSKGLESDVPWRAGDSEADITDGLIRRMNEGAGVRSQSWSDFQAIHLLDELAMTIEMATRGAKMHSYTKVPDYVRLLGKTGHMINMSLIPTRDGEGFDPSEGMPYETMLRLRDQYPDTAGNICIGVNDEQILRLLDSDEIDYVIPYHHSGNSIATRRALNIPEWTSYQDIQSEKGDGEKPVFRDWFDIDRARETAARENANPTDPAAKEKYGVQYGAYKAMQEAADRYLQICADRGLTPKFKGKVEGRNVDFTNHPNYWKLLIDRKMVNQIAGEVIEQKPVQPIFDPAVIYGDPADGNVGGILGRALEYYDAHQADVMYAVAEVTRSMGKDIGAKSEVIEQIIGESVEDIRNGDVLFEYRETDDTYRKAVESGDTETAQRMVDDAARAAGYNTTKVYHGSHEKFNSFSHETSGGLFNFAERPENAEVYALGSGGGRSQTAEQLIAVDENGTAWEYDPDADVYEAVGYWSDDLEGTKLRPIREADKGKTLERDYVEGNLQDGNGNGEFMMVSKNANVGSYYLHMEKTLDLVGDPGTANSVFRGIAEKVFANDAAPVEAKQVTQRLLWSGKNAYLDFWTVTKSEHATKAFERYIVPELKKLGYDSLYHPDDSHKTYAVFDPGQIKSADPITYDDKGNVIPLSERFSSENDDIRYDLRVNPESAPSTSPRDIASSPEFEAFVKAYDAVHGEGAARTIVRTTEQFDRERARQRKREATAAQMARLPETEAKLRRMAEAAERSRKDESKINAIKNPAVRRAKLSAHLAKQEAEAIRRVAEIDAQMRVADQAYRDNVEMQDRLAEQKARAEERLRGVKADYQERLDRERVRTAQAKFEGKQNASERVQRERYKQWWWNRVHEEDLRQARAEGRERVRQAREEERARAAEHARQVRDYRAFRNRNADVISEQRQNRHNTYPTGEGAIGNMVDRKQASYNAHAAADQAAFEQEYLAGQASAASRTGAAYVPGAPDTEIKPYLSTADTSATPPGNTFKPVPTKTGKVVEAVKGLPEKARHAASEVYRLMVNSAQPLDDIAKKQEKAGFLATASDYVTAVRNAPAVASYIISEGLTDKSGNPIGKSLADVVLVHGADDVTFSGETVTAQQAFQDYLLHKHNVGRMSFTVRAKQDLDALIEENPWIPDFVDEDTSEFTRELYGLSEEQREIVARWADLNRRFREAKNKPIFPAENDTVWTAEQSQARVELYEREQPWMKDKAEELYQWLDTFMREYAVGVSITAEEYEAMRTLYPHYVPTYREGKSIGKSTNAVAGSVSAGKAVHEAKGGTSEVRWIQDTLAEQVMKIVSLQKQNELLLNLVDSAMLDSDGTMFPGLRVTPESMGYSTLMTAEDLDNADHQTETLKRNADGTYTVTAWDDGKRVSAIIPDDVYNALFSMFGQRSKGYQLALNVGRKISAPMKAMITGLAPFYAARNAVKDPQTGTIQAEGGVFTGAFDYNKNYWKAYHLMRHDDPRWQQFKALGGRGVNLYRASTGLSEHTKKLLSPNALQRLENALAALSETPESAARFAAYLQYLDYHGDTPENRMRAVRAAAEITTDFSRSGDIGRLLNAWVPYSNAAIQGADKALRSIFSKRGGVTLARAAIEQAVLVGFFQAITHWFDRDDEYEAISDYHKDRYFLFPTTEGKWVRIPREPFYGTLFGAGLDRVIQSISGREDAGVGYVDTALEALNVPFVGAKDLGETATSVARDIAFFGPMFELKLNEDFAGREIVPSEFKDYSSGEFAPLDQQYNDETSAVAYLVSKVLTAKEGPWSASPIQVDHILRSYMGDFYHELLSLVDLGLFKEETLEDLKDTTPLDVVLAPGKWLLEMAEDSFVVDSVYSNRYTGEYYDMLDAMAAQIAADEVHMPEGEHKNTLTYRTKQAIENKYGKDISAAYKTARSAVSEAQKRDAREEAVRLSIEALDFYEQAMAGKYGSDPSKYVKYEQYGNDVCEALLQLTPYEEEFKFEPNASSAPSSLTVDKVKYELTAEQRDDYKALYVRTYSALARQVISSQEYRMAGARRRAELLEDVASNAREQTRENYKVILSGK